MVRFYHFLSSVFVLLSGTFWLPARSFPHRECSLLRPLSPFDLNAFTVRTEKLRLSQLSLYEQTDGHEGGQTNAQTKTLMDSPSQPRRSKRMLAGTFLPAIFLGIFLTHSPPSASAAQLSSLAGMLMQGCGVGTVVGKLNTDFRP